MDEAQVRHAVIERWEGYKRRKERNDWINLDQELIKIKEVEANDDNQYWASLKFLDSERGKVLMIMIGKKGHDSKVQFFLKDGEDQVTSDQVGDLNPRELFLGFKAYFSDGTSSETKFKA